MLGFFTVPSNAIAVICAVGVVLLLTRWRRAGTARAGARAGAAVAVRVFAGRQRAAAAFDASAFRPGNPTAASRTASSCSAAPSIRRASAARDALETDASAERLFAMLEAGAAFSERAHRLHGGSGNLIANSVAEAPIAGRLLRALRRLAAIASCWRDNRAPPKRTPSSRDELVEPKPGERWLLVTSAFHMPRSIGAFRNAGFDVEAYPVDWRTARLDRCHVAVRPASYRPCPHRRCRARMDRLDRLLASGRSSAICFRRQEPSTFNPAAAGRCR